MIPADTPIVLRLEMVLTPPKYLLRKDGTLRDDARQHPIGARDGDVTNYAKGVEDALNGIAWADDCQVVDLRVTKRWAKPGEAGQVIVHRLEAME